VLGPQFPAFPTGPHPVKALFYFKAMKEKPKEYKLLRGSTSINEEARRKLSISRDEYALCSYIHYRQADPRQQQPGWCSDDKDDIAYFVGISRQSLRDMAVRMEKKNLLQISGLKGIIRTTEIWVDTENACKESLHERISKKAEACKESLHDRVRKVDTDSDFRVRKLDETNKVSKIDKKEIEGVDGNTPLCEKQTVVTIHTPDQISETAVTVVEEVVFSLEAEKEPKANIPPAAGAPRKPRATKPAADRSAEIAEHLGTNELKTFFAAIHPEWAKWIAYKAVEKKGKYKAVETEAAAVAAFARKTGYDPAAAALAIEHSILGSYQGIYLPKSDNKPQSVPAPRYSFADSPQAHTPEQMLQEIRAFYTAHVDELQAIQATAGTAYKRERLTEVITAFCAHRVKIGKASESFERQNGALCSWLQEEKKRDAARVAGPGAQTVQYSTRAAAEIRYAKREEI